MTKDKLIKIADSYGFDFKGKNHKGFYALHSRTLKGHIITSPTLKGLYNCLMKFGA